MSPTARRLTVHESEDFALLHQISDEVVSRAAKLYAQGHSRPLNSHNDVTRRADCLQLLRAAIELAPTLPPRAAAEAPPGPAGA